MDQSNATIRTESTEPNNRAQIDQLKTRINELKVEIERWAHLAKVPAARKAREIHNREAELNRLYERLLVLMEADQDRITAQRVFPPVAPVGTKSFEPSPVDSDTWKRDAVLVILGASATGTLVIALVHVIGLFSGRRRAEPKPKL
jgi:hypothetical protein